MVIVDSYSESNAANAFYGLASDFTTQGGQSFTGDGGILNSAKFYMMKTGSPTGSAYAKIYAHSGTFGTNGVPTGSPLATSDAFDVSTLTSSPTKALQTFTFSGVNKITLTNGTKYFVVVEYTGGTWLSNDVDIYKDLDDGTHAGNPAYYISPTWTAGATTGDVCFYVYKDDPISGNVLTVNYQGGTPSGVAVTQI